MPARARYICTNPLSIVLGINLVTLTIDYYN